MRLDAKLCAGFVEQSILGGYIASTMDAERPSKKLATLHVRLSERALSELREIAEEQGRPVSNLAAHIITSWIREHRKKSPDQT
jgi:hypothetical protein